MVSAELLCRDDSASASSLTDMVLTNCSRPQSNCGKEFLSVSGTQRLTSYVDIPVEDVHKRFSIEEEGAVAGECEAVPLPRRFGFDMIGLASVTEDILRGLYEACDVHHTGGVERGVLRELMRTSFSHFGAPCSERDLDRFFESVTPFHIRRRLTPEEQLTSLMPFDEFCVAFLSWLRR
ncbi:unnamed protein product [Trypanosoma congolense IL3000]|uniref:WGS project CAEQ00000000 data, annotated contig 2127 n=1 Tax=Trypanosoma congolense (strain IL3000) TaxID=1068625 RepID=F9WBP3_TRYCI|nr:unnamed protein product [Trypanosoma congolense IL3000]